jgi:hypothetical protein
VTIRKQSHAVRSIAMKAKRDLKESFVCSRASLRAQEGEDGAPLLQYAITKGE